MWFRFLPLKVFHCLLIFLCGFLYQMNSGISDYVTVVQFEGYHVYPRDWRSSVSPSDNKGRTVAVIRWISGQIETFLFGLICPHLPTQAFQQLISILLQTVPSYWSLFSRHYVGGRMPLWIVHYRYIPCPRIDLIVIPDALSQHSCPHVTVSLLIQPHVIISLHPIAWVMCPHLSTLVHYSNYNPRGYVQICKYIFLC